MKKFLATLLIAVLLVCTAASAEYMVVHITADCYDVNSVGKNWSGYCSMNDYQLRDGDIVDIYNGKYTFYTEIVDNDSSPDVGYHTRNLTVNDNKLYKGFSFDEYVDVMENQGFYKDYYCTWRVHYDFYPLGSTGMTFAIQ